MYIILCLMGSNKAILNLESESFPNSPRGSKATEDNQLYPTSMMQYEFTAIYIALIRVYMKDVHNANRVHNSWDILHQYVKGRISIYIWFYALFDPIDPFADNMFLYIIQQLYV